MKLISLQLLPNGKHGWYSSKLFFGENITQLYGPNGCGKTPIVQSLAFCLGYPSVFRNDIYENCNLAILEFEIDSKKFTIKRKISRDVDILVIEPSGNEQIFCNEKEFSEYIFTLVKINKIDLVSTQNKSTKAYLSTLLPLFFLDQDEGYKAIYCPPKKFIQDQFSEMVRLVLNLPPKNSFNKKKDKLQAKERLNFLDRQVEASLRNLNLSKENIKTITKDQESLKREINLLVDEIENLKNSEATHHDSFNAINRLIQRNRESILEIKNEISEIQKRVKGFEQITSEINSEIETLSLNEEARRVFLSFNEICSSSNCKLFQKSSEAYAKNLLYLKDQMKDLERNSKLDKLRICSLNEAEKIILNDLSKLLEEKKSTLGKSEISSLIDVISEIKNTIFNLQNELHKLEKHNKLETLHIEIINDRQAAFEKYQAFSTSTSQCSDLVKLRSELRQFYLNWLDCLNTNNVSRDITFRDDFVPILGNESISQLKGSTRIRAVLAYHAALLELFLEKNKMPFNFFILDTPKQHEIHNNDLDKYIRELKRLSCENGVQIIFSTTEYHYNGDHLDVEWVPEHSGEKQNMFLYSKH
ncbi:AAA family ATPase [Plesiomonas shigelloides]|uniref:ATP-binding protein n=1 Tax=Plesiomonas shigelloides TaxID=703 RepID=UPI0012629542|nr:ATP-binding protein [Plesiomonas shigelloides]KAB7704851.1 AAA family ATPase [Plesiomonas shigelloides]